MVTSVRTLDEGAWVNVNDARIAGVSDVWELDSHAVCDCTVASFLVEVFVDVGVDGRWVDARAAGQCIECGERGTTGWLRIGRTDTDRFRPVSHESVQSVQRPATDRYRR